MTVTVTATVTVAVTAALDSLALGQCKYVFSICPDILCSLSALSPSLCSIACVSAVVVFGRIAQKRQVLIYLSQFDLIKFYLISDAHAVLCAHKHTCTHNQAHTVPLKLTITCATLSTKAKRCDKHKQHKQQQQQRQIRRQRSQLRRRQNVQEKRQLDYCSLISLAEKREANGTKRKTVYLRFGPRARHLTGRLRKRLTRALPPKKHKQKKNAFFYTRIPIGFDSQFVASIGFRPIWLRFVICFTCFNYC